MAIACLKILGTLDKPYMIPFVKYKELHSSPLIKEKAPVFGDHHYMLTIKDEDLKVTFDSFDDDKDGFISLAEHILAYHLEVNFNDIDENKDGFVSAIELNQFGVAWPEVVKVFQDHN